METLPDLGEARPRAGVRGPAGAHKLEQLARALCALGRQQGALARALAAHELRRLELLERQPVRAQLEQDRAARSTCRTCTDLYSLVDREYRATAARMPDQTE